MASLGPDTMPSSPKQKVLQGNLYQNPAMLIIRRVDLQRLPSASGKEVLPNDFQDMILPLNENLGEEKKCF
jgi:hypothetical protein